MFKKISLEGDHTPRETSIYYVTQFLIFSIFYVTQYIDDSFLHGYHNHSPSRHFTSFLLKNE